MHASATNADPYPVLRGEPPLTKDKRPVLLPIGLVTIGIVLLVVGGETLLRGAVALATLLRVTPAVVGLTVVAAGTSVPELAVSGIAAYQGQADIAVANVVGSNIFNITVILGVCALIRPFPIIGNTLRLEYPVLVAATLLVTAAMWDGQVSRQNAAAFIVAYFAFITYTISLVRRQMTELEASGLRAEVAELTPTNAGPTVWLAFVLVIGGVSLLGAGAQATVTGAVQLARLWGWSERLIGLTIVSAGTGLPEVVASIVSSVRGRSDVAMGNVVGSNLFNSLMILGVGGAIAPLPVQSQLLHSDCLWMAGVTLLLCPIIISGRKVDRREGLALLGIYGVYLGLLLGRQ